MNFDLYGLRNGVMLKGDWWNANGGFEVDSFLIPMRSDELSEFPFIWGVEAFRMRSCEPPEYEGEAGAVSFVPFVTLPVRVEKDVPLPPGARAKYLTQVEIAAGLGGTLRLGVNAGELLDFIIGWLGVDIFGDDREAKKPDEKPNQSPNMTDGPAP